MKYKHLNSEIVPGGFICKIGRKEKKSTSHVKCNKPVVITLFIVGMGIFGGLMAKPTLNQGISPFVQMAINQQTVGMLVDLLSNKASVPEVTGNIEDMEGTTWSYTEHVSHGDRSYDVKTYFIFTSQTDVVWLLGTPKGNMFPVGFGTYNPSTGNLTFSSSDKLHEKISLYYADNTIIFKFDPSSGRARLYINDDYLSDFYNDGKDFYMTKLGYTLTPKNDLVGTFWKMGDGDETYIVYFKSWNEAILHGESEESCAYVYIDDMVSIKSGDNITDENLIGRFRGGNEMPLCREGIDPYGDVWCGTLHKVK